MLAELRVRHLGVIDELTLVLGPGLTALTGETGAGKTLLVEAIELLVGGRADQVLVRPGQPEAMVEGRFTGPGVADGAGDELVLARAVPVNGRSRSYVDGRMAPLSTLAAAGVRLVDLHGQHTHQSLLHPAVQRAALDTFGAIGHDDVATARRRLGEIDRALADIGGDTRARTHELDLLRFQVAELESAGVGDPEEDAQLAAEEERLAGATAYREAAVEAHQDLAGDGGATDRMGSAIARLGGPGPLASVSERLRALAAEVADSATDLRRLAESLEDDPERLARVRARRHLLRELRRKYGDTLDDVISFELQARARLDELSNHEERAASLDLDRARAATGLANAEAALGAARREAAPRLATAVEAQLRRLAMPGARFEVRVGPGRAGEQVTWVLGANAGEPALPLAKVASGGELARTMLAVRLVLGRAAGEDGRAAGAGDAAGPDGGRVAGAGGRDDGRTLIFDEVDAGIGGEAAVAVGRALADLGRHHQVLVVTHLPQVAAFADQQVAVRKEEVEGRTVARVEALGPDERIVEVSRMLSGRPDSVTARRHAEELLASAQAPPRSRRSGSPRRR